MEEKSNGSPHNTCNIRIRLGENVDDVEEGLQVDPDLVYPDAASHEDSLVDWMSGTFFAYAIDHRRRIIVLFEQFLLFG